MGSEEHWPVKVRWIDGLKFSAIDEQGHYVVMGVPQEGHGEAVGFSPTKLLLASLAGCTAIDIVLILRKERQNLTGLEVLVKGEKASGSYPHPFTKIELRYIVRGRGVSEQAVRRAIELSDQKYCSVGATLKGVAHIRTSYDIVEETSSASS